MELPASPNSHIPNVDPRIPHHVAIIMDGNGRWATERGLPRLEGHRLGVENIHTVLEAIAGYGVEYVTIFAFSTENWARPVDEVEGIMGLLRNAIQKEAYNLHKQGVRIIHLGRTDQLAPDLREAVDDALKLTKDNTRMTLSVAFNYGGRGEILEAIKNVIRDAISPDDLDESLFSHYLYTSDLPDPDLIMRTGGEQRLSNFLLWQSAYSEFYSTPTLWPDIGPNDIEAAFEAYLKRKRRFGSIIPGD